MGEWRADWGWGGGGSVFDRGGGGVLWSRGSCLSVLFTGLDQRARLIVYSFGEKT